MFHVVAFKVKETFCLQQTLKLLPFLGYKFNFCVNGNLVVTLLSLLLQVREYTKLWHCTSLGIRLHEGLTKVLSKLKFLVFSNL
jgi:hypothetical protein